jgi:hypothetical protein
VLHTTARPANRDHGPRTTTEPPSRRRLTSPGGQLVGTTWEFVVESVACPAGATPKTPPLPAPFTSMLRSGFDSVRKTLPGIPGRLSLKRTMSSGVMGRPGPSRNFACKGGKDGLAGVGKALDLICPLQPALKSKGRQTPRGGGLSGSGRGWPAGPLCSASGHGHGQRHRGQQWGTPMACCAAEVQSGKPTAK